MILNELGEQGLNNTLQARLNMIGTAPAPSLTPELQSSFVLESDRPEWGYYKNETPWRHFVNEAAGGAGIWTSAYIQAPRNQIVVITEIEEVDTASQFEMGWGSLPAFTLTAFYGPIPQDNRFSNFAGFNILAGPTPAQPPISSGVFFRFSDGTNPVFQGPLILANLNRGLVIRSLAANRPLQMNFKGYTRPLLPNELV